MQLTDILCLSKDYTSNDANEMAAVMQSTHLVSPSGELQWRDVKHADAKAWMEKQVASSLKSEFQVTRMSAALDLNDANTPQGEYAEHLIIRDLDLDHLEAAAEDEAPGRIVAHADWRFTPCFEGDLSDTPNGVNNAAGPDFYPRGLNTELRGLINDGITSSVTTHFRGLPFFYLLGISTLTPSHLRQGIAKRLVRWVDPYVDHYGVPVLLYASPSGLHLYRSCGYEEYRDFDVAVDLGKWGVEHTHRHVVMIRWPRDDSRLSDAWREWRNSHKEGRAPVDTTI